MEKKERQKQPKEEQMKEHEVDLPALDENPELKLSALLHQFDLTISTAESCTGGLVAAKLVNVAGSSAYFKEGFVTYSNKAKRRTLGVSKATIRREGAVSEQTAKEMAAGAAMAADADIAVSVTGNAGPDAEEDKPLGLIYFGVYYKGKVKAFSHRFSGERNEIRQQAALAALHLCIRTIERAEEKRLGKG